MRHASIACGDGGRFFSESMIGRSSVRQSTVLRIWTMCKDLIPTHIISVCLSVFINLCRSTLLVSSSVRTRTFQRVAYTTTTVASTTRLITRLYPSPSPSPTPTSASLPFSAQLRVTARTPIRCYSLPSGTMSAPAGEPVYRHYRKDFGPLQTRPLHLDLFFDVRESRVRVVSTTTFEHAHANPINVLKLNSKELEIESVEQVMGANKLVATPGSNAFIEHVASFKGTTTRALKYEVDKKDHFLNITLAEPLKQGEQIVIRTVSVATPTAHILEGLYYDWTPAGAPRTIISQCQQYGFQRIVPSIDAMPAKAFYTTRIIADKRYSHLITNGDLAPGYFDPASGKPTPKSVEGDNELVEVIYYNHKVNMASYLFFLGCGSYVSYNDEFEYCDGQTSIAELLVFPGLVEPEHARTALKSLIDSIYWCYLSTGPEAAEHAEERKKIYQLIPERDQLKARKKAGGAEWNGESEKRLADIRAELRQLISVWKKTGYAYTGQIYREISMQNSDYGGMENVGNTTIIASRMVPSRLITDQGYLYMEGVKIHEFYHNINGSQVTGESPFEIWLNEAVTVYIQRQRESDLFGDDFMRLKEVLYAFIPGQGPLAIDNGPNAMPIEPRGFNRTQELISAMTYAKAPEFVNMVALIIGKAAFNKGLDHYHTKYAYNNASTADWIRAMEEASGVPLMDMADLWLRRSGHPHITYAGRYDAAAKTYTVELEQSQMPEKDPRAWIVPISWGLVKDGKVIKEGVYKMSGVKESMVVRDVAEEPDFLSFARSWSYFGTHSNRSASIAQLAKQARTDPDVVNRYFAYRAVADRVKAEVIESLVAGKRDYSIPPNHDFVQLHATLLFDETLTAGARASILREGEDIHSRPDLSMRYWEIADARMALLQAVYDTHGPAILKMYNEIEGRNQPGPHINQLHDRALKHHLFTLIAAGNGHKTVLSTRQAPSQPVDVSSMAKSLLGSSFMADQLFALSQYLQGPASADAKQSLLSEVRNKFSTHPDSIESYVAVLTGLDSDDAPKLIRQLMQDKTMFDVNLAGHARTACRMWAAQRKRSLLSDEGLSLTVDMFTLVGKVNQYSAQSFLAALNDLPRLPKEQQDKLLVAVRKMHANMDPVKEESLYNQLSALIAPFNKQ